jgi:hypothetical protein
MSLMSGSNSPLWEDLSTVRSDSALFVPDRPSAGQPRNIVALSRGGDTCPI